MYLLCICLYLANKVLLLLLLLLSNTRQSLIKYRSPRCEHAGDDRVSESEIALSS